MPRFSANLSLLFCEHPLPQRFAAAAGAGFSAVEIQFPYEMRIPEIRQQLSQHQLSLDLINIPAGDWSAGDRGIACHPDRVDEFRRGVELAVEYALALECPQINCLAGITPAGITESQARQQFLDNLRFAATTLRKAGLQLNLEPINTTDIPGFMLCRADQAAAIINELQMDNLRIQYDIYHMQVMEPDPIATLQRLFPLIGHIQIADHPGRHQPGSGDINFVSVFRHLDRMGYTGRVALEYNPQGDTESSLSWISACRSLSD